jgi:hypothetical protein
MIQTVDGAEADNDMGDPIGNWLISSAELIGIQQIIWDRWIWRASRTPGSKGSAYTGQHPHNDHLHVELTPEAAALMTPFFAAPQGPPEVQSCGTVPPEGSVIDEGDACAHHFGPAQYWRSVEGVGYGGSLLWTNAYESATPSNWARWTLEFVAAGRYRVETNLVRDYAVASGVRYEIKHGEETSALLLDQSASDGWTFLGDFDFVEGGSQHVTVFDNSETPVTMDQRIVFDALRLTPCPVGGCPDATGPTEPTDPTEPPHDEEGGILAGGCSAGGRGAPDGLIALLLVGVLLIYRVTSGPRRTRRPSLIRPRA